MSEQQSAAQKGAPKAAIICLIISAAAILLLAWVMEWAPYYKTYGVLFVVVFLALLSGWVRSANDDETQQAIREMNQRDKRRD